MCTFIFTLALSQKTKKWWECKDSTGNFDAARWSWQSGISVLAALCCNVLQSSCSATVPTSHLWLLKCSYYDWGTEVLLVIIFNVNINSPVWLVTTMLGGATLSYSIVPFTWGGMKPFLSPPSQQTVRVITLTESCHMELLCAGGSRGGFRSSYWENQGAIVPGVATANHLSWVL